MVKESGKNKRSTNRSISRFKIFNSPEVGLKVLCDLPHETLEGQLADQELGRLLVPEEVEYKDTSTLPRHPPPDLPQSNSARSVTVGLLDSSSGGSRLPGSFGGQLLPGR